MAVELTGFSELIADLAGMAADLDNGPGVDRALQAGAVPVEWEDGTLAIAVVKLK